MSDRLGGKANLGGLDQDRLALIRRLRNEWCFGGLGVAVTRRDWSAGVGVAEALVGSLDALDAAEPM